MMSVAATTLPARAQESNSLSSGSDSLTLRSDGLGSGSECTFPKEGRWNVQNLEGSMDCKGAVALSKKLGPVRDDGVIFVMEDDCSSLFGDSMTKSEEDVLMTRPEGCGYEGTIEGTHDGITMGLHS
jgi:hypothetical protein